jgi:hypothetical protein
LQQELAQQEDVQLLGGLSELERLKKNGVVKSTASRAVSR